MFWPPTSRSMKYEFLPPTGCALFLPAVGPLFSPAVGRSFHPLWVRSSHPLWVRSSHPLWVRSSQFCFDHPSRHSGPPGFVASASTILLSSAQVFWLLVTEIVQSSIAVVFTQSAGFMQRLVGAAVGCMKFLFVRHALRDILMAFHELLGGEVFARVRHAPSRAARGFLACPVPCCSFRRAQCVEDQSSAALVLLSSRRYLAPVRSR